MYDGPESARSPPGSASTAANSGRSSSKAGLAGGNDHVLACLLALDALRGSEACTELSDLALANGHRTVRILGKGAQPG